MGSCYLGDHIYKDNIHTDKTCLIEEPRQKNRLGTARYRFSERVGAYTSFTGSKPHRLLPWWFYPTKTITTHNSLNRPIKTSKIYFTYFLFLITKCSMKQSGQQKKIATLLAYHRQRDGRITVKTHNITTASYKRLGRRGA